MSQSTENQLWTGPECLVCLTTIAYELLQRCTSDPEVQFVGIKNTYKLLDSFTMNDIPTKVAIQIYRMILKETGKSDPFKEIKKQSNKIAKAVVGVIQAHVTAGKTPYTRFRRALAAAIAGNVIDFGTAGHTIDMNTEFLEQIYQQIHTDGFAIDHSSQLFNALQQGKTVVYLADNAGEIYFDLFLLEQMKERGLEVIFVVKGGPVINDATLEDVKDPMFQKVTTKIITTGTDALGVSKTKSSPEFLQHIQNADLIIAKGQSNFETLYYHHSEITTKPIYFLFRTKCVSIARFLKQAKGTNIIMVKTT